MFFENLRPKHSLLWWQNVKKKEFHPWCRCTATAKIGRVIVGRPGNEWDEFDMNPPLCFKSALKRFGHP